MCIKFDWRIIDKIMNNENLIKLKAIISVCGGKKSPSGFSLSFLKNIHYLAAFGTKGKVVLQINY